MPPLIDSFGRRLEYLRLSVTDHCNLRCVYCLPANGFLGAGPADLLSDDEIHRVVSVAAGIGIGKIRITGGEPLVRPGLPELMRRLASVPNLSDLSLSTNGMCLSRLAGDLRQAGLMRINVSLDTLRPERFRNVTRAGDLSRVLEGMYAALEEGFSPVKVNTVVMKGVNDDEIPEFVSLTHQLPLHVRFIELMPIGETGFFNRERRLPLPEMMRRCGPLEAIPRDAWPRGFGPARYFKSPGARGTVGFISALSCNFCDGCNRLRLTSRGRLMPCLASEAGVELKGALRAGRDDEEILALFRQAAAIKPERHEMSPEGNRVRETFMCALGG